MRFLKNFQFSWRGFCRQDSIKHQISCSEILKKQHRTLVSEISIPKFWWNIGIRNDFAIVLRKLEKNFAEMLKLEKHGLHFDRNWKIIWKSSKILLGRSFKEMETTFWTNFPHLSVEIFAFREILRNYKKILGKIKCNFNNISM